MAAINEKKHSKDLFKNSDGSVMIFFMRPCNERQELRPHIEYGGGKVTSKVLKGCIKLAEKGSMISSDDYISTKYIEDCLKENKLLAMDPYRVTPGTRVRSPSESSDHSINSFSSNDSMSPASYIVQTKSKDYKGRSKYTKEEDIAMITFLMEEKRYKEAFGIRVWKDMERQKITSHTASSMNTRYRKHILPNIQNYKYDVDRRWLTKLTGGSVVKETEPEFSVDALFTLKKKSSRKDTSTLGKKHLAGGSGDVYHFASDDDGQKEERTKNSSGEDNDIEIEDNTASDTNKTKKSNKNRKQNHMEHCNDKVNFAESCKRVGNPDDNDEDNSGLNKSEDVNCNKVHKLEEKTVKSVERSIHTDEENEKMNETYTAIMSPSDIFMISEESCQIEENVSGEEPVTKVICLDDGRLQMSQDGSDKNFDEECLEMAAKGCKESAKEKSDKVDSDKSKKKTVMKGSERLNDDTLRKTDNQNVEVVRNSAEVSEEAETQPPQMNEICSNEVTSSGQCEYENNSDNDSMMFIHVDSDANDDDSFDEMLKSYITKHKAESVEKSDTCNNAEIDSSSRKTSDTVLSKRKSQAVKDNGGKTDSKKRKIVTENKEISSSRDEKKQKLVADCNTTCQRLSVKYDISVGFVAQLLFQCSGDVNRTVAYIEYGPHSPELPPWTENDDKALEKNPKATGLIYKFGLPDVKNRYKFMNYEV